MGSQTKFWQNYTVDPSGCWLWHGATHSDGYGLVGAQGAHYAHRLSWILHHGPIPDGLTIDHLCNVRHCVNPAHLEPVTREENLRRARERRATCGNGHPWTDDNIKIAKTAAGTPYRSCRQCARDGLARHYAKNKERILAKRKERRLRLSGAGSSE